MSTAASIANFAVDMSGNEVPIRYKAEDLVNRCAPEGYIWQRRTLLEDRKEGFYANYDSYYAQRVKDHKEWLELSKAEQDRESRYVVYGAGLQHRSVPPTYDVDGDWTTLAIIHTFDRTPYYIAKKLDK